MVNNNFENLEKQLAKDSLEKALKDLHGEITKDIEKNKATFSKEIKQTLNDFKIDLEDTLSKELDKRISAHLKKNFLDISTKVTSSFYESSSPFLKRTEEDFKRLHMQGENTIDSWKTMMNRFNYLWNRPFLLFGLACILTGALTSVFFSYLLVRADRQAIKSCASNLHLFSNEYFKVKKALEEKTLKSKTSKPTVGNKTNKK